MACHRQRRPEPRLTFLPSSRILLPSHQKPWDGFGLAEGAHVRSVVCVIKPRCFSAGIGSPNAGLTVVMVEPRPATKPHAATRSLPPPSGMGRRIEKQRKE